MKPEPQYGLLELAKGTNPIVDLIAIHGLNGDPVETFTHKNGTEWLKDLLPSSFPNARILTYGYDARTRSTEPISCLFLFQHAANFLDDLVSFREDTETERRPVIFIAHSMGGLLLKHALINSERARPGNLESYKSLSLSTYGIMFFATPHLGGNHITTYKLLQRILGVTMHTNIKLINDVTPESVSILSQLALYNSISQDYYTEFYSETLEDPDARCLIVEQSSAVVPGMINAPAIGLHKNHRDMVKFAGESDNDFKIVQRHLKKMIKDAAPAVERKWESWERYKYLSDVTKYSLDLLIPARNPKFVGRQSYLSAIHQFFTSKDQLKQRACLIWGMGGLGKTQTALEYAYTYHSSYSTVVWIDATSPEVTIQRDFHKTAERYLNKLGEALRTKDEAAKVLHLGSLVTDGTLRNDDLSKKESVVALKEWFGRGDNNDWLLIFDGYDNIDSFQLSEYFPSNSQGRIMVTSRRACPGLALHSIELDYMDSDTAADLLLGATGIDREAEKENVNRLLEKLGGLPLAIAQANAYLSSYGVTLQTYLERYSTKFQLVMEPKPQGDWRYAETAWTTWKTSYDLIKESSAQAGELLLMSGFVDNQGIPEELFRRGMPDLPELQISLDFELLSSFVLVRKTSESPRLYWMHPVVHDWVRSRKNTPAKELADLLLSIFGRSLVFSNYCRKSEDWAWERQLLPHVLFFLNVSKEFLEAWLLDQQKLEALGWITRVLCEQRQFETVLPLLRKVLSSYQNAFGVDNEKTLELEHLLSTVLYYANLTPEALTVAKDTWDRKRRVLKPSDRETLRSLQNYAAIMPSDMKRAVEAEALERGLLKEREETLGLDDPDTFNSYNNLGNLLLSMDRAEEAEKFLCKAVEGRERVLGVDHPDTLYSHDSLENARLRLGNPAQVEGQRKVLENLRGTVGTQHPFFLMTMRATGQRWQQQGHYDEAINLYRELIDIQSKATGIERKETLFIRHDLAYALGEAGQNDESIEVYRALIPVRERVEGPDNEGTLASMNNLGWTLQQVNQLDEAIKNLSVVLERRERVLPEDHEDVRVSLDNLAAALRDAHLYERSLFYYKRLFEVQKKALGPEDKDTLDTMENISLVYFETEEYKEEAEIERQLLEIRQRKLGDEEYGTLWAMSQLALTLENLGELDESEKILRHGLPIAEKVLGPTDKITLAMTNHLGLVCRGKEHYEESEKLHLRVLEGLGTENILENPWILKCRLNLGKTLFLEDKFVEASENFKIMVEALETLKGPDDDETRLTKVLLILSERGGEETI